MRKVLVHNIGLTPYREALALQESFFNEIVQTKLRDGRYHGESHLIITEHEPIYTIGKGGKAEHLLSGSTGAELLRIGRGGDITFHGPGQLVVYPILDLEQFFTDIKKYMRLLEEVVIRMLADYGLKAGRLEGATGVWLDVEQPDQCRKICAMGVRASRWVTMHGLALNVNTDLQWFGHIVPCGIADKGVTSLQQELRFTVDVKEVGNSFLKYFSEIFEADCSAE